jgi:hypothetical protein
MLSTSSKLSTRAATSLALLNPLGMPTVFIGYTGNLRVGAWAWSALLVSLTVLGLTVVTRILGLLVAPSGSSSS